MYSHVLDQDQRALWTILEALFKPAVVHSRGGWIDAVEVEAQLTRQGSR
jgi:hypothetical protein